MTHRRQVARQLQEFLDEVNWIRSRIESLSEMSVTDCREVTARFGVLKDRLQSEYRRTDSVRSRDKLNPVEKAFYAPAVHKTFVELTKIRKGTRPFVDWSNALYCAKLELTDFMPSLESE
jgi:hypothetical protein